MRRQPDFLPAILVFGVAVLGFGLARGDDRAAGRNTESSISEMTSRVLTTRWPRGTPGVSRMIVLTTQDHAEDDAIFGLFEFEDGSLGLSSARRDSAEDAHIVISSGKADLDALQDSVFRCKQTARR